MRNNVKLWMVGIAVAVLVVGGAYLIGASGARAQLGAQPSATQPDPMVRIAAALERIAAAMEKSAGGPVGGMGQMGSGMMGQMQGQMQQCHAMMEQMHKMMQGMQGMMSGPMAGPTPPAPSASPTEADLTRTSQAEGITVAVTFMNPLLKPEESAGQLVFKIALDTHAGDLMQYDLTKLAVLRTSEGAVVDKGFIWEPQSESSHHRLGLLKVDAMVEGKPLITKDTKYIELELKDIGIPSRVFKWEEEYLGPKAQE
jgi:hypothetical protein